MQEAQSKFSIDFDPDNAAEVDFLEGNLSPEGSVVVHFRRSSTSSSTGRVYCKVRLSVETYPFKFYSSLVKFVVCICSLKPCACLFNYLTKRRLCQAIFEQNK